MSKRLLHPWSWWRRGLREAVVWPLDLDDGTGDGSPSLTKIIALLGALTACVAVLLALAVTAMQFWLYVAAASIAFGRPIFKMFLGRIQLGSSTSTTATKAETTTNTTTRQIQETVQRRELGADDGTEPS